MDNRIKKLFNLYESGRASAEERKIVEDWFSLHEGGKPDELSDDDKIALFKPLDDEIKRIVKVNGKGGPVNYQWLSIAAAILVVFTVTLFFLKAYRKGPEKPVTYSYISAPRGKKTEFSLSDGSVIFLNSGSRIQIPSNFNETSRTVALSGEAYFSIKHNSSKPFVITTNKLLVTDLGTTFNVKAYPGENQISIAVESGMVKVEKHNENGKNEMYAAAITHNQELVYNKKDSSHLVSVTKTQNMVAWHKNQLCFVNATFDEMAPMLERWYDISVKLEHNTGECRRYTVSFSNEPLNKVLSVLEKLSGVTYQIKNKTVIINL